MLGGQGYLGFNAAPRREAVALDCLSALNNLYIFNLPLRNFIFAHHLTALIAANAAHKRGDRDLLEGMLIEQVMRLNKPRMIFLMDSLIIVPSSFSLP